MKISKKPITRIDGNDLAPSFFVSIITLSLVLAYFAARFGFENNSLFRIFQVVGLSFFLIFLPEAINLAKLRFGYGEFWYNSKPFVSIVGLFLVVILGFFAPFFNLRYALVALGFICFAISSYFYLKGVSRKTSILVVFVFALALSGWVIGAIWGNKYLTPLFFERITVANVSPDTLFHASVVSMIKTHFIPSTGLDGVSYLQYHWGSHYIFAQLSKLLNLDAIDFYNLAYPVIFVPFIIGSFIHFITAFQKFSKLEYRPNWKFLFLIVLMFVSVAPTNLMGKMGIIIADIFVSESYGLSIAFTLIFSSLALILKTQNGSLADKKIFALGIVPFALGLIGLTKISLMLLVLATFAYLFFRLKLYKYWYYLISAGLSLAVGILILKVANSGGELRYYPFFYLNNMVRPDLRFFFPITYFFWVWVYLFLRLKILKAKTLRDLRVLFANRKILDLEMLIVVALVGIIPGTFFDTQSMAFYFSDFQRWLALSLIISFVPLWWPDKSLIYFKRRGLNLMNFSSIVFVLIAMVLVIYSCGNVRDSFLSFVRRNLDTRYKLISDGSEIKKIGQVRFIFNQITKKGVPALEAIRAGTSEAQKDLNNDKKYQLIKLLKSQYSISDSSQRETAIYIPQDNFLFWNMLSYRDVHFLAPSLSGMSTIGGIQPFVPVELSKNNMKNLTKNFDSDKMKVFGDFYLMVEEKQSVDQQGEDPVMKYMLKEHLTDKEKIIIYDLLASGEYKFLKDYGFGSYDFPSETEYLEKFSSDEKICKQALDKKFSKVLIITTDKDLNPQGRELDCR